MPRRARLDAPDAVHHVMGRGIEKRPIFADDVDRRDFVQRLARIARSNAFVVYAWALMPNHFHLLVRTKDRPLEPSMRSLLTGYANHFNRRHRRVGHLFQNRYKSILVQEDRYFLKLVHYVHRNPIPKIVPNERALQRYRWTGHAAILGLERSGWQDVRYVLECFAPDPTTARRRYRRFLASPARAGSLDLDGGGLVRSTGGWRFVPRLRNGRERFATDERILGTGAFVESALRLMGNGDAKAQPTSPPLEELIHLVARACNVDPNALEAGTRTRAASRAREGLAYLWVDRFGQSARMLSLRLGIAKSSLHFAIRKGRNDARRWDGLVSPKVIHSETN